MNWETYSQIDSSSRGMFRFLFVLVNGNHSQSRIENEPIEKVEENQGVKEVITSPNILLDTELGPYWFKTFKREGQIPKSQFDFRDRLVTHLKENGYSVHINKEFNKDKIDIYATRNGEMIGIEVRYKTALLQTTYNGSHIHLKNQGAQDVSRYDYMSDLGKIERVVKNRSGMKGYAILLTNDHLYWNPSRKSNTVDEAFHIHDNNMVSGVCVWREEASQGTISGREEPISFDGSYRMKWQPYLSLGAQKNEQFKVLLMEVNNT